MNNEQRTAFNFLNWLRGARDSDEIYEKVRMLKRGTINRNDFLRFFNSEAFGMRGFRNRDNILASIRKCYNQLKNIPSELTETQYETVLGLERSYKLIEDDDEDLDERLHTVERRLYTFNRLSCFRNIEIDLDIQALARWAKRKYEARAFPNQIGVQVNLYFENENGDLRRFMRSSTRGIYLSSNSLKNDIIDLFTQIRMIPSGYNFNLYMGAKVNIYWNTRRL